MNIEVRNDSVVITGYVNAVERYSKPITSTLRGSIRTFVERMRAGVFKTALKRNDSVKVLLNHKEDREVANTKDGTAKLEEDNIGLRAEVTITDAEVVEKARDGKLTGWSFGFYCNADEMGKDGDAETRTVTDMDLVEVSILDDSQRPAYNGTSIETRSEGEIMEIREELIEEQPKEERGVDIEQLADIVAKKVYEMLKPAERAEEVPDTNVENTEEAESVAEPEAPAEEEQREEIDYSALEERLAKL